MGDRGGGGGGGFSVTTVAISPFFFSLSRFQSCICSRMKVLLIATRTVPVMHRVQKEICCDFVALVSFPTLFPMYSFILLIFFPAFFPCRFPSEPLGQFCQGCHSH